MTARALTARHCLVLLAASAFGCADGGAPKPKEAPVNKTVTIKGSDTMVILAQRVAERFMAKNPGKTVQVTGGGSGTGIASLINGTTEIATSSRQMKDSERKQLETKRGTPAVEHKVALDGLAVFVNDKNPIQEISLEQLERIYRGEVKSWKELTGADAPIILYGRENNSGTYAYFKEHVLKEKDFAAEMQTLPGTAAVVNAVSKDPNAIGYGGIAYGAGIKALKVKKDSASPAVEPSLENVVSGAYPISRHLFFYTPGQPSGVAREFLDFVLSEDGQKIVGEVGYYPLARTIVNPQGVVVQPGSAQ